jgi:hypothetical protein
VNIRTHQTALNKPSLFKKTVCLLAALVMFAVPAFATPTGLTTQVLLINGSASAPITAGSLAITFAACDATNGNSFTATGREVLLVFNSGGSAYTFTVTSVADSLNRLDTSLTTYSVAAGAYAAVEMKNLTGWIQSGAINMTCSNTSVKFAVIQTN